MTKQDKEDLKAIFTESMRDVLTQVMNVKNTDHATVEATKELESKLVDTGNGNEVIDFNSLTDKQIVDFLLKVHMHKKYTRKDGHKHWIIGFNIPYNQGAQLLWKVGYGMQEYKGYYPSSEEITQAREYLMSSQVEHSGMYNSLKSLAS